MKKIFIIIVPCILAISLIGFLFNLPEYDFFTQFDKLQYVEWVNPIDEFRTLARKFQDLGLEFQQIQFSFNYVDVNNPMDFFSNVGEFFNGMGKGFSQIFNAIGNGFKSLWDLLVMPIYILKDLFIDLWCVFKVVMIIIGFNI